jgi:hypothetical protein
LGELYDSASVELRAPLRVPFNLRLAADLLGSGVNARELAPIRSQIELLNRYWRHRIIGTTGGDDREAVLSRATQNMVDRRRLQVDRTALQGAVPGGAIVELRDAIRKSLAPPFPLNLHLPPAFRVSQPMSPRCFVAN